MRTLALLLAAALAVTSSPVRAEDVSVHQRGFLSGLGLGLLIGGLAGAGAGLSGVLTANDAGERLTAYGTGAIPAEEQASVTALQQRLAGGSTLAVIGFVAGGLALVGGITCLAVDGKGPRAAVAFVPTGQGGAFVFSARF